PPRTLVAGVHARRRAALPALADVGAVGLLAHRVQVVVLDRALQPPVGRAARRGHLQPRRLSLAEGPNLSLVGSRATRPRARPRDVDALVEGRLRHRLLT